MTVSCMDPRVIPEELCGLSAGQIPVIRCAGGRAQLAVNDIAVLNALIGISEIVLIHHQDCGLMHKTDEQLRQKVTSLSVSAASNINFDGLAIDEYEYIWSIPNYVQNVNTDLRG
ncbi:hypothetical protein TruAng_002615 [Truncatella angustata]|nr:hypothetical protein TruAng_002615 [Truncatella angustata]